MIRSSLKKIPLHVHPLFVNTALLATRNDCYPISAVYRRIRINRTVIAIAVSFMIGYYTAATQLSLFTLMKPLETDSIMSTVLLPTFMEPIETNSIISTVLLPSTDRINDFFHAQAGQDQWIFDTLMGSNVEAMRNRGGIFIEFGARNGVDDSNTHFFETFLGWYGILIEANPSEHGNIVTDRPNSAVVNGAVCEKEGETVTFFDADFPGWGGVKSSYDTERLTDKISVGKEYEVTCNRLDTLVDDFGISQVDLMTVDTEGSELIALMTFPFDRVKPKLIAVEILTGTEERDVYREQVKLFMETKGYKVCKYSYRKNKKMKTFSQLVFFTLLCYIILRNEHIMLNSS
jgi:FkbM family methyltransferase